MRSDYGEQYLRKDRRIICKALAMSLETGHRITIAVADYNLLKAFKDQNMKCLPSNEDIIYFATSPNGQQMIVTILDGRGYWPKFSARP